MNPHDKTAPEQGDSLKLYSTLASWWPLVSCVADYAEEAEPYWRIMSERSTRPIETMLGLALLAFAWAILRSRVREA